MGFKRGVSKFKTIPGLEPRARELQADPHNYDYVHIARLLTSEFKLEADPITKNSVCGFFFRAGLRKGSSGRSMTPEEAAMGKAERKFARETRRTQRLLKKRLKETQARAARTRVEVDPKEVVQYGPTLAKASLPLESFQSSSWPLPLISLRKLNADTCRWPFECDDGETRYCGQDRAIMVYCVTHGDRAYREMPTEKRNATEGRAGGFEDARSVKEGAESSDDSRNVKSVAINDPKVRTQPEEAGDGGDSDNYDPLLEGVEEVPS